jgi:hypothetical protein
MNLWSLWKSRNLRIWQNISETCHAISARAQQVLVEWREANIKKQKCNAAGHMAGLQADDSRHSAGASSLLQSQIKWKKPQQGKLKKAKMMWSNPICWPEIGEALGLLYAMQWVHELQLTNLDFEMGAKLVVDYFNKGSNNVSEFGAILEECKRWRNVYFENSKVEFSRRQANEVAHTLAREALFFASPQVFNDVPLCILTLINNQKAISYFLSKKKVDSYKEFHEFWQPGQRIMRDR